MPIAEVQNAIAQIAPGTNVTIDNAGSGWNAPVVGNLIVVHVGNTSSPGTVTIAGYTQIDTQLSTTGVARSTWFTKIAVGTETTIPAVSTLSDNMTIGAIELSGAGTAPVIGTLPTPTQGTAVATLLSPNIVIAGTDAFIGYGIVFEAGLPGATNTWTNTFAPITANNYGRFARRIVTAAATYNTQHTWLNNRNAIMTGIAITPGAAAGGGGGGLQAGPISLM